MGLLWHLCELEDMWLLLAANFFSEVESIVSTVYICQCLSQEKSSGCINQTKARGNWTAYCMPSIEPWPSCTLSQNGYGANPLRSKLITDITSNILDPYVTDIRSKAFLVGMIANIFGTQKCKVFLVHVSSFWRFAIFLQCCSCLWTVASAWQQPWEIATIRAKLWTVIMTVFHVSKLMTILFSRESFREALRPDWLWWNFFFSVFVAVVWSWCGGGRWCFCVFALVWWFFCGDVFGVLWCRAVLVVVVWVFFVVLLVVVLRWCFCGGVRWCSFGGVFSGRVAVVLWWQTTAERKLKIWPRRQKSL